MPHSGGAPSPWIRRVVVFVAADVVTTAMQDFCCSRLCSESALPAPDYQLDLRTPLSSPLRAFRRNWYYTYVKKS
jgi:hypothetical protein